jgi:hypothetical protein
MILASEQAKTVHALDRSATVTGDDIFRLIKWIMRTDKRKRILFITEDQ